ncbi:prephenate dehydrogenase [Microaerobacter geothermalis]|uniref:prephenate dehydrogenase n=1 Tax=Microaerobacter geothermalis TaxID=674972 RepID=UPI001F355DA5|nr:prephenate dehydrogenase [Microaerobacter geothermalis]MCF6093373.1 prephenate dehydrogenase [Microaerobacter geothermalis]
MKKIAIIGVGLIGGSLALSLKETEATIIGYDLHPEQLSLAQSLGVIDVVASSMEEAVEEADFIFLCTPVNEIHEMVRKLLECPLKEGVIISDTGSTKEMISSIGAQLQEKGVYFIGGHPMAGSHKSGVTAANHRLFENAYYVLTPSDETPEEIVNQLVEILSYTKAQVITMSPSGHDEVVGAISHFPHVIASGLVNLVAKYDQKNPWYQRLAAGGFRDITRIASSNPRMWRDVLLSNREVLLQLMEDWNRLMEDIKESILEGDGLSIESFFEEAKNFRNGLPERKKGALPPLYDLYVDIPDHPGIIGKVTTLLGHHEISLTNIRILEIREDIMGVLRLTFRREEDMERAQQLLISSGYQVHTRE